MQRRIKVGQILNLRDLGGYETEDGRITAWGKLFRSDLPTGLKQEDIECLLYLGITTVIDLRSDMERERQPDPLSSKGHFSYFPIPAFGNGRLPTENEEVPDTYLEIAFGKESMYQVFKCILKAEQAVLFHCTAGKDRTGVTAALLLLLAGVCKEDIIADYILTGPYLQKKMKALCKQYPEIPIHYLMPKAEYMETFLEKFETRFPNICNYFAWLGFNTGEIEQLKKKIKG